MRNLKQHGFTMIETLVSLVIISIGVLGFALLQVESLKATKTILFSGLALEEDVLAYKSQAMTLGQSLLLFNGKRKVMCRITTSHL